LLFVLIVSPSGPTSPLNARKALNPDSRLSAFLACGPPTLIAMASPNDPTAAAKYRADQLAAEAEAAVKRIGDAPGVPPPPAIPEHLTKPVVRPDSMKPKQSMMGGLGEISKSLAIGLDFLLTPIAGGLVGYLVDRWQGWYPYATLIGIGVGFLTGTVRLLRRLM
jgi:hypothetical protein